MALSQQEISDRIEIQDLMIRYARAIDTKDYGLLDTCFLPDAHVDYVSSGGTKGAYPEVRQWLEKALLRITFEGKHYFLFEEVTDANLAFNLGHQEAYTFRRRIKLREGDPSPEEWNGNETFEAPGAGFGKR